MWQVRPRDEVLVSLVPILLGLAELAADGRDLSGFADLPRLVEERCRHLLRSQRPGDGPWIVPVTPSDRPLAALTALVWSLRGDEARLWTEAVPPPTGRYVAIGDTDIPQDRPDALIDRIDGIRRFCAREYPGRERMKVVNGCA
jgi:hypothetical protein